MPERLDLTVVWAPLLATAVFTTSCLGGFDLGVGILFAAPVPLPGRPPRLVAVPQPRGD
jgi:cytochrome bd-type quinol oxidase subunit 2